MQQFQMKIIGHIRSDFPTKFGVPRQSGLAKSVKSAIVFEKEYQNPDALRGLEGFSHLWLVWLFSESIRDSWSPTVRPPKLGGNVRMGVFATRSPFRPNPIGLSCVKLEGVKIDPSLGPVVEVSGADLMDGTPILDIKPYVPYADCQTQASGGFAVSAASLSVDFPETLLLTIPGEKRAGLLEILSQDPRPGYQHEPERIYGVPFAGFDIRFTVCGDVLHVREVVPFSKNEEK